MKVTEDDEVCDEIASAVQLFLSGVDDEGCKEPGDGACAIQGSSQSDCLPPLRAADVGQPVEVGLAVERQSTAVVDMASGPSTPAPPAERAGKGANDFLLVLKRRPLPAEFTGAVLQMVQSVILDCIISMYEDGVKPVLGVVQSRLREGSQMPEGQFRDMIKSIRDIHLVIQALLPLCARDPENYAIVPPVPGAQPVILLAKEPQWFQGWDLQSQSTLKVTLKVTGGQPRVVYRNYEKAPAYQSSWAS